MASISHRPERKRPYRVFYKDPDTGKARNKSFLRRKDATQFIETIRLPENPHIQTISSKSVSDALARWYDLSTTTGRKGREAVEYSTARKYALHLRIITEMIGDLSLCDLDHACCAGFRDRLLAQYSRPYAKKILTSFKSALGQAVCDSDLKANPAADVFIQISSRYKKANRVQIPTLAEVGDITNAIDSLMADSKIETRKAWSRYGPLFLLLLYSGLRPSEACGLTWENLDRSKGGIQLTQSADEVSCLGPLKPALLIALSRWRIKFWMRWIAGKNNVRKAQKD